MRRGGEAVRGAANGPCRGLCGDEDGGLRLDQKDVQFSKIPANDQQTDAVGVNGKNW